jgi:hypothetical protein
MCWLDSWMHWAKSANPPDDGPLSPVLQAKHAYLKAIDDAPGKLLADMDKAWPGLGEAIKTGLISENEMVSSFRHGMRQMISDVEEGRHDQMARLTKAMAQMEQSMVRKVKNN